MRRGFSLLEVTVAVAVLSGLLISVARIISYSYVYAERIEDIYLGTELAWLKLHEIEEEIKKEGMGTIIGDIGIEEEGEFDDPAYEGFKWKYSIKKVFIPIPDVSAGDNDEQGYQEQAAGMLSGYKTIIEDFFKERIRKLTLEVFWGEGRRESERVVFTVFITEEGTVKRFKQFERGGTGGRPGAVSPNRKGRNPLENWKPKMPPNFRGRP